MENLIKFDMHVHTSQSSGCGCVPGAEQARLYHGAGYGGIVITDHLLPLGEFAHSPNQTAEQHLEGYYDALSEGKRLGLKVLLGAEVRVCTGWEDFLVIGLDERGIARLYDMQERHMKLPQLFKLCNEQGWIVYQAHPYRSYLRPADPKYLHGVEVRNENPRHDNQNHKAEEFARRNNLMTLAGSDAHIIEDVGVSGIYVPDTVKDNAALVAYLNQVRTPKAIVPSK